MAQRPAAGPEQASHLDAAARDFARAGTGRLTRSSDNEDDVQNACLRALELDEPQKVSDPARYILRITRNLFIDRMRKKKRETALFDSLAVASGGTAYPLDPERILAGRQELDHVLDAIGRLPPRCREAFMLHRFHGLSYAATARRMGVSTSMVEKHIAEAMLRILKASRESDEIP